jgi:hypothetical protein
MGALPDNIDFLEHFDTEEIINIDNKQLYKYTVSKEGLTLIIILNPKENKIYVEIVGIVECEIYDIESILYDKKYYPGVVFVVKKIGREYPFAIISVKSGISLSLDLELTGQY